MFQLRRNRFLYSVLVIDSSQEGDGWCDDVVFDSGHSPGGWTSSYRALPSQSVHLFRQQQQSFSKDLLWPRLLLEGVSLFWTADCRTFFAAFFEL